MKDTENLRAIAAYLAGCGNREDADFIRSIAIRIKELEARQIQGRPRAYLYRFSDPFSGAPCWRFHSAEWNGQTPKEVLPLYAARKIE